MGIEADERALGDLSRGNVFLGIELGSTRIKASLIDSSCRQISSGSFEWENRLEDGVWTYRLEDAVAGIQACYADLVSRTRGDFGVTPKSYRAIGVSGMMHGYLALDAEGRLLSPFRTWRNTMTGEAAEKLSAVFSLNIPQRWSVAHLYHSVLRHEAHVERIARLTTLAGYVHWLLTGEHVAGIDEASGMFPVDTETRRFHPRMLESFDKLVEERGYPWKLGEILPRVAVAGESAGKLTREGALLLDPTGTLEDGIPLCPPEGDAGTGMVATNSVGTHTGNVSVGTSVFAMVVLDKGLSRPYREIDLVMTPAGDPVAMVHCNNGTGDIDGWLRFIGDCLKACGMEPDQERLYRTLFQAAALGEPDCGGLVNCNYLSGEHITGFAEGRPMFLRLPDARFTAANFMRAQLYSVFASLRIGMEILTDREAVRIDRLNGHGGFFRAEGIGRRAMAAALKAPVTTMENAGEGGPWGMAILAAYMAQKEGGETLEEYLSGRVFAGIGRTTDVPEPGETEGFETYLARFRLFLNAERAVDGIR